MPSARLIELLGYAETAAVAVALLVLIIRKQQRQFPLVAALLALRLASVAIQSILWSLAHRYVISRVLGYRIDFYVYYSSYALECAFYLGIVYSIYKLAMAPLPGLQNLGVLMFRWAAVIAVAVSFGSAIGPHRTAADFVMHAVTEFQRTGSILTLCLLVFVTFAIQPMGLSYRSKVFGVSLGLGLLSVTDLISSAWIGHSPNMASLFSVFNSVGVLSALAAWTVYFALPEEPRRLIMLPTTSPFLRWNQISEALGDAPGNVALGGIHPDLFDPAELEVMKRSSIRMMAPPIVIGK